MFVAFAVAATLWGALLLQARSQRHALHHLMTALVVAKALTLLSQAGMYHYIRATGSPDGWNIAFYVFTFLRGLLFFTVGGCARRCMPEHDLWEVMGSVLNAITACTDWPGALVSWIWRCFVPPQQSRQSGSAVLLKRAGGPCLSELSRPKHAGASTCPQIIGTALLA